MQAARNSHDDGTIEYSESDSSSYQGSSLPEDQSFHYTDQENDNIVPSDSASRPTQPERYESDQHNGTSHRRPARSQSTSDRRPHRLSVPHSHGSHRAQTPTSNLDDYEQVSGEYGRPHPPPHYGGRFPGPAHAPTMVQGYTNHYGPGAGAMIPLTSYSQNPFAPAPPTNHGFFPPHQHAMPHGQGGYTGHEMMPYQPYGYGGGYGAPMPQYYTPWMKHSPPATGPAVETAHVAIPAPVPVPDPEVEKRRLEMEKALADLRLENERVKQQIADKKAAEDRANEDQLRKVAAEKELQEAVTKLRRDLEDQVRADAAKAKADEAARVQAANEQAAREAAQKVLTDQSIAEAVALSKKQAEDKARADAEAQVRADAEKALAEATAKANTQKSIDEAVAKHKQALEDKAAADAQKAAQEAMLKATTELTIAEAVAKHKKELEDKAKADAEKAKGDAEAQAKLDAEKAAIAAEKTKLEADNKAAVEALAKAHAEELAKLVPEKKKPIRFKDAVGRKFSFPFHLCATWAGMEELIRQAFLHVEVIGPHVANGHYDLIGPTGEIILPQVWEIVVEPDWQIVMHMWPLQEPEKPPENPLDDKRPPRPMRDRHRRHKSDRHTFPTSGGDDMHPGIFLVDDNSEASRHHKSSKKTPKTMGGGFFNIFPGAGQSSKTKSGKKRKGRD